MFSDILKNKNLKDCTIEELQSICDGLRENIISTVMQNGGHLSSNLGVIELTVALHYVFDFPKDKLIFDVGHQCYAYKILSDRADSFSTLRKSGGISGFPKREESEYDCYNTGHAGTSVSAALGMAKARDIKGEDYRVIALIGDGSFNNGLIYEAFNSLRPLNTNVLVILNDNGMSISPTVGSMHEYLEMLSRDNVFHYKVEKHANIFERFGFIYDGVYDGNDLQFMIYKLQEVKTRLKRNSIILHVLTKKGKGYSFCEEYPQQTHGIVGEKISPNGSYSEVFGQRLLSLAEKNDKIVAVTAAMTPSLGLSPFFERFPKRSIDVGICEEHATILCSSLAAAGLKPYYAVYSTFLQRSIDEIIIDICSQNLPVTLCIDRAGISGEDGETHQGVFDLSFLTFIPNLTIAVPKDIEEFKKMIDFSATYNAPLAIRYPKESSVIFDGTDDSIVVGKWEKLTEGDGRVAVLACGERTLKIAKEAETSLKRCGIAITIINARFVKPLDIEMLDSLQEKLLVTLEDNQLIGGYGSLVCEHFSDNAEKRVKVFAYRDEFIPHGTVPQLMSEFGLSCDEIVGYILKNADR